MQSVLVVEDDPAFAAAIEAELKHASFDVEIAADTFIALNTVERRRFDMFLVDLGMPSRTPSGLSFARMMRYRYPRARVIFVTGYSEMADSLPEHSGKVFIKPVELDALVAEIRTQLTAA